MERFMRLNRGGLEIRVNRPAIDRNWANKNREWTDGNIT